MSIGLGRLASVGVRVVGEAESPGLVDAGPRPTVLDALGAAGVRKSGSLRRITVRRASGEAITVDLYAYLIGRGDAPDLRLSAGDTVSIPPIGPTVAVAGSVQRPGIFEIHRDTSSPAEAIELAGGLTGFALEGQIQIERTVGASRVLIDAHPDGRGGRHCRTATRCSSARSTDACTRSSRSRARSADPGGSSIARV
jgi:polysaccharide export outer membrane protein